MTTPRDSGPDGTLWVALLIVAQLLLACGGTAWKQAPHDRLYQRADPPELHTILDEYEHSDWWDAFYNQTFSQLSRMVSPGYQLGRAIGGPAAVEKALQAAHQVDFVDPRRVADLLQRPHEHALGAMLRRLSAQEEAHRRARARLAAVADSQRDDLGPGTTGR